MAATGRTVYQYDRSIASLPTAHSKFKWFKLMIEPTTGNDTIKLRMRKQKWTQWL